MIIRKSPAEIEQIAASGAILVRTLRLLERQIRPGVTHRRARRGRRALHPLAGRGPDLQGLPRLPGVDLRLAQLDDRARDPRPLRARARRRDLARRRRHARRLGCRRGAHVPGRAGRRARAESARGYRARRCSPASSSASSATASATSRTRSRPRAEGEGLPIVRSLVGHGVGRDMHEDPQIPNFGEPGTGPRLESGMVLAIEPMTTIGSHRRARGRRRLGDLLAGRLAGRALRVHGRDHRRTGRASSRPGTSPTAANGGKRAC